MKMMKTLNVQIHPNRMTEGDPEDIVEILCGAADGTHLSYVGGDRGEDNGPYINLRFSTTNHASGWRCLRDVYNRSEVGLQLALSTIVTCEGEHGWGDYLLLHHYDPEEKIDDV